MDGLLVINKPKGYTSRDIVNLATKKLNTKKIGHTGTLDPDVEGVLVLAINKATKLIELLQESDKVYKATLCIGKSTATEDISGDIVESKEVLKKSIKLDDLDNVINSFIGNITQVAPMYSAVKYKGKELYKYAYDGITIEKRPSRNVYIKQINRLSDIIYKDNSAYIDLEITCSKGTYIRTLLYDISLKLGYPGCMSYLLRTKTSFQTIEQSISIDNISINDIIPLKKVLSSFDLEEVLIDDYIAKKVSNGVKLENRYNKEYILLHNDYVYAIYKIDPKDNKYIRMYKLLYS